MRLLLDTHIAIWTLQDDRRLSTRARELIADPGNLKFVSVVSLWEMALKRSRNPARLPFSPAEAAEVFEDAGLQVLDLNKPHVLAYEGLPRIHADPFDRLLAAQALQEPLRLLTHDRKLASYSEAFLLV